jgi:hypothetical protein
MLTGKFGWKGKVWASYLRELLWGPGHDYTIYSNGPTGRARMYAFLALITAFLTPIAQHGVLVLLRRSLGDDSDTDKAALFLGGFTTLLVYGVLINVFDVYLWRMKVGGWMFYLIGLAGRMFQYRAGSTGAP